MKETIFQNLSRRNFLNQVGLSSAGLCLGSFGLESLAQDNKQSTPGEFFPNAFVHIDSSGVVSFYCARSEMGQGVRSTLPVLLADELGTTMQHVKVIQAVGDKKYGDQNTDGSSSIRGKFDWLRGLAATARTVLIEEAAQTWKVEPKVCDTKDNYVYLKSDPKKQLPFGELVAGASKRTVPDADAVTLRPLNELKHLKKDLPLLDGLDYVTGKAKFGADIDRPGMAIAVIARPPVVGGKVKKLDSSAAKKVKGVIDIVEMPAAEEPYVFKPWGGVAVIAENTWAAESARSKLKIDWDHGKHVSYNTSDFRKTLLASAKKGGESYRKFGDVAKGLKQSTTTHEAEYYVPHLPHLTMEPPVAIAEYTKAGGGSCEVWAATQNPQSARSEVARILELDEEKVTVNVTLLGGGFGRKSKPDFCGEAAWLSKKVGKPIRVQFTREDDIRNDYLNTVNAQIVKAGVDKNGKLLAWERRSAFPPISSTFNPKAVIPGARDFQQGILDLAIDAKNFDAQACSAKSHVRVGWLRSVYNIFHAFATNCFLDEFAHKLKKDPLEFMLSSYTDKIVDPAKSGVKEMHNYGLPIENYPVDGNRLRNTLIKVAEMCDWKNRSNDKSRGYGLATHRSFLSYVGVAAAVKKVNDQFVVDEAWIAIDAGLVINTERVRAQMEGSFINGMSHFYFGGITHKAGQAVQSNFHDAKQIRLGQAPRKITVEIMHTDHPAGGVGEPGVPPSAPAIANAIFALSGKRYREFAAPDLPPLS